VRKSSGSPTPVNYTWSVEFGLTAPWLACDQVGALTFAEMLRLASVGASNGHL